MYVYIVGKTTSSATEKRRQSKTPRLDMPIALQYLTIDDVVWMATILGPHVFTTTTTIERAC